MAEELTEIRRALRRQRDAKRKRAQRGSDGFASPWTLDVALSIASMTGYDFNAAATWILQDHRRGLRGPADASLEEVAGYLQEQFVQADLDRLSSWVSPDACLLPSTVVKAAAAFVAEYKTACYVERSNQRRGSVVSSGRVVEQYTKAVDQEVATAPLLASTVRVPTSDAGRSWCVRWRKKVGAGLGKLPVEEPLEPGVAEAKATGRGPMKKGL